MSFKVLLKMLGSQYDGGALRIEEAFSAGAFDPGNTNKHMLAVLEVLEHNGFDYKAVPVARSENPQYTGGSANAFAIAVEDESELGRLQVILKEMTVAPAEEAPQVIRGHRSAPRRSENPQHLYEVGELKALADSPYRVPTAYMGNAGLTRQPDYSIEAVVAPRPEHVRGRF